MRKESVKKYLMEMMGAMFLVLSISLTGNPIAIGAMYMILVYIGEGVSGGHFNPAVSLAAFLRGGLLNVRDMWYYILFQVLGGGLAAVLHFVLTGQNYFPQPARNVLMWKVFLIELLFTFILAFAFLAVHVSRRLKGSPVSGLVIGFTLLSITYLGGTFNPAVPAGCLLFSYINKGAVMLDASFKIVMLYVTGSLAGGALAALLYQYMND